MNILVIDDNPIHQKAARQTLGGHDLTIVGTYDEAYRELGGTGKMEGPVSDYGQLFEELEGKGLIREGMTEYEKWMILDREYWANKAKQGAPSSYDVVLCDLLMPASGMTMGPNGMKFVGQEMPVGFGLALMAALRKVKYIAVVTWTSHHDHPAVAMLDAFHSMTPRERGHDSIPPRFTINESRVGFFPGTPMVHIEGTTDQYGKDWGLVLKVMTC